MNPNEPPNDDTNTRKPTQSPRDCDGLSKASPDDELPALVNLGVITVKQLAEALRNWPAKMIMFDIVPEDQPIFREAFDMPNYSYDPDKSLAEDESPR